MTVNLCSCRKWQVENHGFLKYQNANCWLHWLRPEAPLCLWRAAEENSKITYSWLGDKPSEETLPNWAWKTRYCGITDPTAVTNSAWKRLLSLSIFSVSYFSISPPAFKLVSITHTLLQFPHYPCFLPFAGIKGCVVCWSGIFHIPPRDRGSTV